MLASRSDKTRMATMLVGLTLAAAASAALFAASPAVAAEKLPKLGAALSQTSVSGLSSGAFMASQFEVAHAENVVGAGIVAGGPFACAETATARLFPYWLTGVAQNAIQAAQQCMQTTLGEPDAAKLFARAKELADDGEIDPLPALAKHNVYLYSGDEDSTVSRPVVEAAKRFYELAGVPEANLTYVRGSGGHAFITEEGGAACGLSEPPFVSDCDYDQARAILGWIYGPLKPASAKAQGAFIVFEQGEFAGDGGGLADEGVVYGPYTTGVQTNPQGPVTGDTYGNYKVVRGGSYERSADGCRVTARDADRQPDDSFPSIGFRIAYFPQAEEGLRGLPLPFLR